ncbi:MAG: hypothetical protein ACLFV6_16970 [Spirulinaceae cyanobacterium]
MIEKISQINDSHLLALHQWCEERRPLLRPTVSRYAKNRRELWIRRYCDLRSPATISDGYRNDRIEQLGERVLPNFDIGLLLLYSPGTQINLHRDHTVFEKTAVSINLGQATFKIAQTPRKGEKLNPQRYRLQDGDVIRFNSKLLHGIEPVQIERWCLVFWHLKQEYLETH